MTLNHLSQSLGACSFIPAEHLYPLCDSLREVLINVGDALRSCPTGFDLDIHELGEHWYAKYRNLIASLERYCRWPLHSRRLGSDTLFVHRNANLFYLLAEQISRRPPRGHKLNSHMSKLHQYVRKFDDLHKRLLVRLWHM